MNVELNGRSVDVRDGTTLAEVIARAGVDASPRGVAVALDGEVVPRGAWSTTEVHAGQAVEVLEARQGG